jgi:hypothetical protein
VTLGMTAVLAPTPVRGPIQRREVGRAVNGDAHLALLRIIRADGSAGSTVAARRAPALVAGS